MVFHFLFLLGSSSDFFPLDSLGLQLATHLAFGVSGLQFPIEGSQFGCANLRSPRSFEGSGLQISIVDFKNKVRFLGIAVSVHGLPLATLLWSRLIWGLRLPTVARFRFRLVFLAMPLLNSGLAACHVPQILGFGM